MLTDVTDVTDATFGTAVMERSMSVPVVVDLWAEWCGPCKTLGPIIEKVIEETGGAVELAKVDVDTNPQIAQAFNVQSIPAVFAIHEGKIVDSFVGAFPESTIREFIEKLAPGASKVDQLVSEGDEPSLRAALELDATNIDAAVALGDLLRRTDRLDEADAVLKPFENVLAAKTVLARIRLQRSGVSLEGDLDLTLEHLLEQSSSDTRTKDSFYEPAATFDLDALFDRAQRLVTGGADVLDIGGVKAGPGDAVDESEELERVVPVVTELVRRFDIPISIDTWRASVAKAAFAEGACIGNDISGFGDDQYLPAASEAGATVVATHIRLRPRVADPTPHYDDVTATVADFLVDRRQRALNAGVSADRIVVDAGLDLGKTAAQSLQLLRDSERLAGLGAPLLLSASNKTFLGALFDLPVTGRREPSLAATARDDRSRASQRARPGRSCSRPRVGVAPRVRPVVRSLEVTATTGRPSCRGRDRRRPRCGQHSRRR